MTYTNPVYPHYFADPFVLWHEGHYYAYGTAPGSDQAEHFPILHSTDLVHWEHKGWALQQQTESFFWAPEVAYHDGMFYLYYSSGKPDGENHQLRVAMSTNPLGYFDDLGHVLVPDQPFSIDAHPFRAPDGQWYLYYAQDFLTLDDEHRVGTGIVVDQLVDMVRLAGNPRLVVRPHHDWHLFKAQRAMYGGVYDWHTVEGPSVLYHEGKYYCFYSGGAWEEQNYGVSYVVADHPLGPYRRADITVIKTVPDTVIGPGHNSFTRSPDGSETFMVYHAWDIAKTKRMMCIDRLSWENGIPVVNGPTWAPQPIPR